MRIATFNILNGRGSRDEQVDEQTFTKAISSLDADVLGLQEVDRNQPRSEHHDLTALAAEAMGAPEHRFVAALSGNPGATWSAATGDEQPDAAAYGVALLSRYPVLGWEVVRLPAVPVKVPHRFPGGGGVQWIRDEPRVAVVAEVQTPSRRLHVACTHLSYLHWWNRGQLRLLLRSLVSCDPLVLLGDLNMDARRVRRLTGMRPLVTGPTFPSHEPTEQLDHILARGDDVDALGGSAVELPVSDHRALVVDVR